MTRTRTLHGRQIAAVGVAALVVGLVSGCGSTKTLSFCTDPTYPPAEFYQVAKVGGGGSELKRQLAGADIDIASEVAKRTGSKAEFVETSFSGIFDALDAKKCDAIISFVNDTADRRQKVDFVDYLAAGQSVMTRADAAPISSVADLYGRSVAVAKDTTEEQFLTAANQSAPSGQTIKVLSFGTENDAIYALQQKAADVYFGDSPIVASAVAADHNLRAGAELVKPVPVGIALRKGDDRTAKIASAIKDIYGDGTMGKILAQWKFTEYALPQQ